VYIRELRTEIIEGASPAPPVGRPAGMSGEGAEQAAAAQRREAWLAERVASEGFDD
jgi:hypothetical protein